MKNIMLEINAIIAQINDLDFERKIEAINEIRATIHSFNRGWNLKNLLSCGAHGMLRGSLALGLSGFEPMKVLTVLGQ